MWHLLNLHYGGTYVIHITRFKFFVVSFPFMGCEQDRSKTKKIEE